MLYLDNGIPVNSATFAKESWFELIGAELLVEHSHTAGGFAEAAGTEAPNCAKGMLIKSDRQTDL